MAILRSRVEMNAAVAAAPERAETPAMIAKVVLDIVLVVRIEDLDAAERKTKEDEVARMSLRMRWDSDLDKTHCY